MSKPEYLNKELAARRSGLSIRRLLELANKGEVRKRHVLDPKSKRTIAVFDSTDLARLKDRPAVGTALVPMRSGAALSHPNVASVIPPVPAPDRPWLTIDEAAEVSGLPASFLQGLVRGGKL